MLREADMALDSLSFAEVHDCFTIAELICWVKRAVANYASLLQRVD